MHLPFDGHRRGRATNPTRLSIWFSNNNPGGTLTVTCTMLTGYQAQVGTAQCTSTKTAIAGGGVAQTSLSCTPADNAVAASTTLGNGSIGINCVLPLGAMMNDTYFYRTQDNGV